MHWLLNFVTEKEGFPGAVLIRALIPKEGLEIIAKNRNGQPQKHWTDGPAKICQALDIDGRLNGINTCSPDSVVFVENIADNATAVFQSSPRIGLESVPEPWRSKLWRFTLNR
jgi:DNA-3-methyladenine glycosylase